MSCRELDKQDREELMIEKSLIPQSDNELACATDVSTVAIAAISINCTKVVWSQSQFDCLRVSYRRCPISGPGDSLCGGYNHGDRRTIRFFSRT